MSISDTDDDAPIVMKRMRTEPTPDTQWTLPKVASGFGLAPKPFGSRAPKPPTKKTTNITPKPVVSTTGPKSTTPTSTVEVPPPFGLLPHKPFISTSFTPFATTDIIPEDNRYLALKAIITKSEVIDDVLLVKLQQLFSLRDQAVRNVLDPDKQSQINETFDRRLSLISDAVYSLTFAQLLSTDNRLVPESKLNYRSNRQYHSSWCRLGQTLCVAALGLALLLPIPPIVELLI